jgi:cation diffusion facilitator CzcD-associated flavoprotein CzcO
MDRRVAIVGAGPGGIVAAKFLRDQGLVPVIFEQSDRAGGQWHVGNPMSGVWPGMPTNTSRVMTHFSDLDYPPDTPPFPDAEGVFRYLADYIDAFDLGGSLRLCTTVVRIERGGSGGWTVVHRGPDGHTAEENFARVVIATGRFNMCRPFLECRSPHVIRINTEAPNPLRARASSSPEAPSARTKSARTWR